MPAHRGFVNSTPSISPSDAQDRASCESDVIADDIGHHRNTRAHHDCSMLEQVTRRFFVVFVHRIGSGGVQSPPLVCGIGTWLEPAR
jgi:hypothetical protein